MGGKFGIVGCQHGHIGAFVSGMLELGWEFEAICDDGDPWLSAKLAEKHGVEVVTDREAYLASADAAIIGVASVNRHKGGDISAALRAGKHVVTDKPMAVNLDDLAQIQAAHEKTGKQAVVMLTMRYSPVVRAVRSAVDAGRIGDIVGAIGLAPHRLGPDNRPRWMFDDELYGGVMVDTGCHSVDLFLWLTGSGVEEVFAYEWETRWKDSHPGITDIATAMIRLKSGATGFFRPDWLTPDRFPKHGDYRLSFQGTKGRIECFLAGVPDGYGDSKAVLYSDSEEPTFLEPEEPELGMIEEFVGYALDGKPTSITTEESVRAHRAVVLCRSSAKEGRPLRWEEVIG